MRRQLLISLGVLPALLLSVPVCAETPAERWERAEHLYRERCSMDGPRGTPEYIRCIDRLVDTADANTLPKRQVDPDSLEARLTRAYGERCEFAGYAPRTGAFGQCLLAYADRDEQARRAVLLQLYQTQANRNPIYNDPKMFQFLTPLTMPQRTTRQCNSIIGNQIVTTTCY